MLQPPHRGIYEFLWSEHKYPVMAVSLKAFQGMASRLGKRPQLLSLLKKISEYASAEKAEYYNALLNAYMHVKPSLDRARRHEIIETLLKDENQAAGLIYKDALRYHESSLAGCRLFFPSGQAVYKFWDTQDRPGLWLCCGAVQLHLSPQQVFNRICIETGIPASEMLHKMELLRGGISSNEYNSWPDNIRLILQLNNMVAVPGGEGAWLHPRLCATVFSPTLEKFSCDFLSAAVLTLEKIWDTAEYPPEGIAQLPEYGTFCGKFNSQSHPAVEWQPDFDRNEAFEMLGHLFWQQWVKDNGQSGEKTADDESGTGVGMKTADEEIDPEEGEHGDDETCD